MIRQRFFFRLLYLALLMACLAFCISLSFRSFTLSDETMHVKVTQEMFQSGQWWRPTLEGEVYFQKPPLKMWLTFIPLYLFGESNFAYRFLDCLLATVILALHVPLAVKLGFTRWHGLLAGFLVFTSYLFMLLDHGALFATQDNFLYCLQIIELLIFWQIWTDYSRNDYQRVARQCIWLGLVVGAAALSKSLFAFILPFFCALFVFLEGELVPFMRRCGWSVVKALALGVSLPACFLLPHFIFTPGAYADFVMEELVERSTVGFHNQSDSWFYFQQIYQDHLFNFWLIIAGLLYACYSFRKSAALRLLLVLAVLPSITLSFVPSRLIWYLGLSLTPLALLSANCLLELLKFVSDGLQRKMYWSVVGAAFCLLLLIGVSASDIRRMPLRAWEYNKREDLDRVVAVIKKRNYKRTLVYAPLFEINVKFASRSEKIYLSMLNPDLTWAHSPEELVKLLQTKEFDFIIVPRGLLSEAKQNFNSWGYARLDPLHHRKEVGFVLAHEPLDSKLFKASAVN